MLNYAMLITAIFLISAVQILFKYRINISHGEFPVGDGIWAYLIRLLKDPYIWFAGFLMIAAASLWYLAMTRMPLSVLIVFAAFVYPLIMAGSYYFLNESLIWRQVLGCGFIFIGVILASYNV